MKQFLGWLGAALLGGIAVAIAQTAVVPPVGQPVLNQARQGRLLTKSDTTFIQPTRGVHIGDASACDIAVIFVGDSAAVTLANLQSGSDHPYAINKLMSTNTTCTAVTALY